MGSWDTSISFLENIINRQNKLDIQSVMLSCSIIQLL